MALTGDDKYVIIRPMSRDTWAVSWVKVARKEKGR